MNAIEFVYNFVEKKIGLKLSNIIWETEAVAQCVEGYHAHRNKENREANHDFTEGKAKIGATCYCLLFGDGEIVETNFSDPALQFVQVKFGDRIEWFYRDGKYSEDHIDPILFHKKPRILEGELC